jgi:hypothetical protein
MRRRLRFAVCTLILGGGLIAGTATASAGSLDHQGTGTWDSPHFGAGDTTLHYRLDWRCPGSFRMHLALDRAQRSGFANQWERVTSLFARKGAGGGSGSEQGSYRIERVAPYRLAIQTERDCHWDLHADW